MKERRKQATRPLVGGGVEMTNATDADGILIQPTNREIEVMSREQVLDFQKRRKEQIADKKAEELEELDFELYKERFTQAGGSAKDAKAAWDAKKRETAAEAAGRVEAEAREYSARRVRGVL